MQSVDTTDLWTVEDAGSEDLFKHLTHPENEDALFDWSLRALVRTALADGHNGRL